LEEKNMLKEFRDFIMRGNVLDLAVAVIIGGAFGKIVTSFVNDIIMPPLGLILGNVDFSNLFLVMKGTVPAGTSLAEAQKIAGVVTWNWGLFVTNVINFLIVAFVIFMLVRASNKMTTAVKKPAPAAPAVPTTKECPYCVSTISIKATRCPNCTSELKA
jgi:large conductance mechanosensitive channel